MLKNVESMTNPELISILIGSKESTKKLFDEFYNINQLDLLPIKNINDCEDSIRKVKVAIELGKRIQKNKTLRYGEITSSFKIGKMLIERYLGEVQEEVIIIFLDTKNQIIKIESIFKGTLNTATVHPRDIFRRCLELSAAKFIVAHNHPSGVISVSKQDLNFTNRLVKCSEVIGCEMLDHLIIGKDSYLSLKEEGLM